VRGIGVRDFRRHEQGGAWPSRADNRGKEIQSGEGGRGLIFERLG
jgi:hypothetical protein